MTIGKASQYLVPDHDICVGVDQLDRDKCDLLAAGAVLCTIRRDENQSYEGAEWTEEVAAPEYRLVTKHFETDDRCTGHSSSCEFLQLRNHVCLLICTPSMRRK